MEDKKLFYSEHGYDIITPVGNSDERPAVKNIITMRDFIELRRCTKYVYGSYGDLPRKLKKEIRNLRRKALAFSEKLMRDNGIYWTEYGYDDGSVYNPMEVFPDVINEHTYLGSGVPMMGDYLYAETTGPVNLSGQSNDVGKNLLSTSEGE